MNRFAPVGEASPLIPPYSPTDRGPSFALRWQQPRVGSDSPDAHSAAAGHPFARGGRLAAPQSTVHGGFPRGRLLSVLGSNSPTRSRFRDPYVGSAGHGARWRRGRFHLEVSDE